MTRRGSSLPPTFVDGFHDVDVVKQMTYNTLGKTGLDVSQLAYGASALGSVFRETDDAQSCEVVKAAIQSGINYIDTAPWYGHGKSERVLGKALQSIPRNAYYIATKVGRYEADPHNMFDFSAERILHSVEESLQRLGLEYVDVIQIHDMEFAPSLDVVINETLPALQKIKDMGKANFIGITGYPLENFRTVLERSNVQIDTILTYCRCSLNDTGLKQYLPYFQEKEIGIINASPISMGLLTSRGPPAWHPATPNIKEACAKAAEYCKTQDVDLSRLALSFSLSQPGIHTTLFSTASVENLKRNLDVVTNPLSDVEKQVMEDVIQKYMAPLNNAHWEGVEVAEYWAAIKEGKNVVLG